MVFLFYSITTNIPKLNINSRCSCKADGSVTCIDSSTDEGCRDDYIRKVCFASFVSGLELKYFRLFFDSARCENARPISFARNTYIRGSRANIVTLSDVLWEVVTEDVSEEGAAEKLSLVEPLAE